MSPTTEVSNVRVPDATATTPCLEVTVSRPRRRTAALAASLLCATIALAGCSTGDGNDPITPRLLMPQSEEMPFNSEFSRDGTYQSHTKVDGIDFVFNIWAAKATPRMGEWHPKGDKYFSFTFQSYDTTQPMRAAFDRKRLVWLERVQVTSQTTTGSGKVEAPYTLDEWAPDVTFDPEARTLGRRGMLITSPKGAFELRNQVIKDLADDTEGVTLTFRATVHVQERRRSKSYASHEISLQIPVAIVESDEPTVPQPVPFNAS